MKTAAISRFVIVAAVAALVCTPLWAQISFPNFTSTNITSLTLNGSASTNNPNPYNVLRLTPNQDGQMGSAFFTTQQPVLGTFSTTFTFQLGGTSTYTADGFAFVIQNSAANALGPAGCGIGFGGGGSDHCTSNTGIANSLAVEFDTYQNLPDDPNNNHVSIQSCLTAANLTDKSCRIADNSNPLNGSQTPIILADGNPHAVSVSFTPSGSCTNTACPGVLDVTLDGNDLFPGAPAGENTPAVPEGVPFDIAKIGLNNGSAWVGFTAATGGGNDNQDILNWTFSLKTQVVPLPAPGVPGITNFNGGVGNNSFDQKATLGPGPVTSAALGVKPILIDRNSCNKLVQQTFPLAQCFVFQNVDGNNTRSAVLFELNCSNAQGDCGPTIVADLGNDFVFQNSDNPGFKFLSSTIGGYVGVLKGESGSPNGACQVDSTHPLKFVSNQISGFTLSGDPLGGTTQKSKPGTSCWTIVYGATGELPPGITITAPTAMNYTQGIAPAPTTLQASYTCKTPLTSKNPDPNVTSPTGPYLTVRSCSQSQAPNNSPTIACGTFDPVLSFTGGVACTGAFDVSKLGLHVFLVTTKDTAGNLNAKTVVYNVVKPKP